MGGDKKPEESRGGVAVNRFAIAAQRLSKSRNYQPSNKSHSPYGVFEGRPIIGECTPINGGIFVGAREHEAVVVDEKYGELLSVYSEFRRRWEERSERQSYDERRLLDDVVLLVKEMIVLSKEKFASLVTQHNLKPDRKIVLDLFLREGVGAPRHQVLLAAYLLEKLRNDGVVQGIAGIDSKMGDGLDDETLVYTSFSGALLFFSPGKQSVSSTNS